MTDRAEDRLRAALLLTNRLVRLDAAPLTARELWALVERVDLADLLGDGVDAIATRAGVDHDEAVRLRTLLDAATAMTFEQERLHDNGISLLSALDDRFPSALRSRLGAACPPFLLVAGPIEWLDRPGLAVVGPSDAADELLAVARRSAELAVGEGWTVVTGLDRGVDQAAMAGAFDAGGQVVGVPAEGITRAARSADIRRRVHAGELCLASPYAPDAPARAANANGRNKIVAALSRLTFVVSADDGAGGTSAGATEALDQRYARVAVWVGDGAPDGNRALVARGAVPITDLATLFDIDPVIPPTAPDSLF
jgi:predicted Rossmann fold nucleotide-binding protein DprA/Smf involved in DNA uptake